MTGPQGEMGHWLGWAGLDPAGPARGSLRRLTESLAGLLARVRGALGIPHAALAVRLDQTPPEGHG